MLEQYTTTDGLIVTAWPDKQVWIVSGGKIERKFFYLLDFLRFMTKEKAPSGN
ncbi:hypothetical protein C9I44_00705 [Lactococcus garvieae]|uniref:hypothetical protein n=1 Tax=Lactococcus garvieae TaxID=1363 RepID=UPI001E620DE3|nr:hypothetical protein [Lactococcus garvieae]MDN5629035.1 hypothetical protein [Lactococcus sp.]UHU65024.1 hypothetical protein C9I44_00705 [Lactococcus garvieae]